MAMLAPILPSSLDITSDSIHKKLDLSRLVGQTVPGKVIRVLEGLLLQIAVIWQGSLQELTCRLAGVVPTSLFLDCLVVVGAAVVDPSAVVSDPGSELSQREKERKHNRERRAARRKENLDEFVRQRIIQLTPKSLKVHIHSIHSDGIAEVDLLISPPTLPPGPTGPSSTSRSRKRKRGVSEQVQDASPVLECKIQDILCREKLLTLGSFPLGAPSQRPPLSETPGAPVMKEVGGKESSREVPKQKAKAKLSTRHFVHDFFQESSSGSDSKSAAGGGGGGGGVRSATNDIDTRTNSRGLTTAGESAEMHPSSSRSLSSGKGERTQEEDDSADQHSSAITDSESPLDEVLDDDEEGDGEEDGDQDADAEQEDGEGEEEDTDE